MTSQRVQSGGAAYSILKGTVAAGQVVIHTVTGNYARCLSASPLSFLLQLDQGPSQFFAQGLAVRMPPGERFAALTIDNTGNAIPLNYTIAYGIGDVTDSRLIGTQGSAATPSRASVLSSGSLQLAAGGSYVSLTIKNLDGANPVYIGNTSAVTIATGYPLGPGEEMTIDHSNGAVWAISDLLAGVPLALLVEA